MSRSSQNLHDLSTFGTLHQFKVDRPLKTGAQCPFQKLIQLSSETPCNLAVHPVDAVLTPEIRRLLDQTQTPGRTICMTKSADCLLFSKLLAMTGQHRLISALCGEGLYNPDSDDLHGFSIVDKPGVVSVPFHLAIHNGPCNVHEISRHAIAEHILNQIKAVGPVSIDEKPSPVFESPNIGTLSSRVMKGPQVHELKKAFLKMVFKAAQQGEGVYDKTIRLKPEFSKMLMLKYAKGDVQVNRCIDGLVGYRVNKLSGKRTFLFVVNSNDFHHDTLSDEDESMMQEFKMDYNNDKGQDPPRIVVVDSMEEVRSLEGEEHAVSLDMEVQTIVNQIEKVIRSRILEHHGCHLFPMYCDMLDQQQAFRIGGG